MQKIKYPCDTRCHREGLNYRKPSSSGGAFMRTAILFSITLLFGNVVAAQPGGGLPSPGASLPDVVVYDEDGRKFSLSELRGEYAVLVFGCLT